ncbi:MULTISPECIES: hypothetical protein [unclassified Rhizobium]|jgi:hypothetical protein|uniref:hypothetical protein n=1 Tax=unclassified Rhizobium TaxID=2613769 RepID=UPI000DDC14FC|nr:hypothetical protein [Rhizobium sp. AN80A]
MPFKPRSGDVCLFENEKAGHEDAPDHRGYFVAHRDIKAGEKIQFVLWSGRKGSARSFGGRIDEPSSTIRSKAVPTDLFGNPVSE